MNLFLLRSAIIVLLASLTSGPVAAFLPPPYGGTMTAPLPDLPVTLDPARASRESELQVISLLYDTIYLLAPDGGPRPHLVEPHPEISADGKTWRLRLRPGVQLTIGRLLTVLDVVSALRRTKGGSNGYLFGSVRSIEAEGAETIVLQLWRRTATLPWLLSAPASAIAVPLAMPRTGRPEQFAGTGPFRLHARTSSLIHLKANPGHFAGRPYLDELRFMLFDRASAEMSTYQVGGLQITFRGKSVFSSKSRYAAAELESSVNTPVFLGIGRSKPYLADPLFRLALLKGIDRRRLGRLVGAGRAEVSESPVCKSLLRAQPRLIDFDRAASSRLVERLASQQESLRVERSKGRIKLALLVDASHFEDAIVAGQIVADLDRLGIEVTMEVKGAAEFQARLEEGRYELVLGHQAIQVPLPAIVLAGALALASEKQAAQRCTALGTCGAKEAAGFMKRLPLLPLVHSSTRLLYDARLGSLRFTLLGQIPYADLYWVRRSP